MAFYNNLASVAAHVMQIVPRLPPAICGVGDYAYLLGRELRDTHNIRCDFLVCDPKWSGGAELGGFRIHRLQARNMAELIGRLSAPGMPQTICLQYAGYGYEKRGCPVWLVKGLEEWRNGQSGRRLMTMFHELYAFGPPWRSSFWTSPLQRWIAKRLAITSDICQTNRAASVRILERLAPSVRGRVSSLPVFSNVGEPETVLPLHQRRPQMVVFGSPRWREKCYLEEPAVMVRTCRALGIEKILDIGGLNGKEWKFPLPTCQLGHQSPEAVSARLAESRAGFLSYFSDSLAKSGIFAAYCAHGLLPVLAGHYACEEDGLRRNSEYISAADLCTPLSIGSLQAIADNARAWYRRHSIAETACSIAASLSSQPHEKNRAFYRF